MQRNTWIIIIVAVIVIIGLIWIFNGGQAPVAAFQPASGPVDAGAVSVKPGPAVVVIGGNISRDSETGCQYVFVAGGGVTPRLDRAGRQICE